MFYYTRAILCHSLKLPELLRRAIGAKVDPLVLDAAEEGYRRATAAGEGQVNRAQRIHNMILSSHAMQFYHGMGVVSGMTLLFPFRAGRRSRRSAASIGRP